MVTSNIYYSRPLFSACSVCHSSLNRVRMLWDSPPRRAHPSSLNANVPASFQLPMNHAGFMLVQHDVLPARSGAAAHAGAAVIFYADAQHFQICPAAVNLEIVKKSTSTFMTAAARLDCKSDLLTFTRLPSKGGSRQTRPHRPRNCWCSHLDYLPHLWSPPQIYSWHK